jgi:PP-loop family
MHPGNRLRCVVSAIVLSLVMKTIHPLRCPTHGRLTSYSISPTLLSHTSYQLYRSTAYGAMLSRSKANPYAYPERLYSLHSSSSPSHSPSLTNARLPSSVASNQSHAPSSSSSSSSSSSISHTLETTIYKSLVNLLNITSSSKYKLLILVSGGLDSMSLLHILHAIKSKQLLGHTIEIRILHFNHKKRIESEEEEIFVNSVAQQYNIQIVTERYGSNSDSSIDNNSSSSSSGTSISGDDSDSSNFQQAARNWRRRVAERVLQEWIAADDNTASTAASTSAKYYVTTGHHLDDQVEGFFMQLLRGAHLSNLHAVRLLDTAE